MIRARSAGILVLRLLAMISLVLGMGFTYILCEMSGWSIAPFLSAPLDRSILGAFAVLLPLLTSFTAILIRKNRDIPWSEVTLIGTLPMQILAVSMIEFELR